MEKAVCCRERRYRGHGRKRRDSSSTPRVDNATYAMLVYWHAYRTSGTTCPGSGLRRMPQPSR